MSRRAVPLFGLLPLCLGSLVIATPAHAATTDYTVTCETAVGTGVVRVFVLPGDTATVAVAGFDTLHDSTIPADSPLDPAGEDVVLEAGDTVVLLNSPFGGPCDTQVMIQVLEASPETAPAGVLLDTVDIPIPGDVALEVPEDAPDFGGYSFNGDPDCRVSAGRNGQHIYGSHSVTIDQAGQYTFRGIRSSPMWPYVPFEVWHPLGDPVFVLYSGFDPDEPESGLVACNSNSRTVGAQHPAEFRADGSIIDGYQPLIVADLEPGEYTLVLLTSAEVSVAEFLSGDIGYWQFEPGPMSTTVEISGPAPRAVPQLAATGSTLSPVPLAVLLGAIGVAVVLFSRRRSAS